MNRKIEVGCLVMIVKGFFPENIGKCGTVVGKGIYFDKVVWRIDFPSAVKTQPYIADMPVGPIEYKSTVSSNGYGLMRIDNPDFQEVDQEVEETADV